MWKNFALLFGKLLLESPAAPTILGSLIVKTCSCKVKIETKHNNFVVFYENKTIKMKIFEGSFLVDVRVNRQQLQKMWSTMSRKIRRYELSLTLVLIQNLSQKESRVFSILYALLCYYFIKLNCLILSPKHYNTLKNIF